MLGRWNDKQRTGTVQAYQMHQSRSRFQAKKTSNNVVNSPTPVTHSSKFRSCASPYLFTTKKRSVRARLAFWSVIDSIIVMNSMEAGDGPTRVWGKQRAEISWE